MPGIDVASTLERTVRAIPGGVVDEILFVDDGSTDDSVEVALGLGCTVVSHARNMGYGAAQKTGYREALASGADVVVMVHPDFQYKPELVPAMASMVVFVDGVADKSRYRSFKIKGTGARDDEASLRQGAFQNDDFTSMYEVLGRRFRRALQGDDEAWALPDLVVIDGGKGQLGRVLAAMQDLGVPAGAEGVDVVALAKERTMTLGRGRSGKRELDRRRQEGEQRGYEDLIVAEAAAEPGAAGELEVRPERVFVPGVKDPIRLRPGSSERYLMERIRDEAHRFAITHHRKRRGKRSLRSALDEIPGVGPTIKKSLVAHFGSVAAIRAAGPERLAEVKGIGPALAKRIAEALGVP